MKIVRPYTIKGKLLCLVLKCLLFPVHLIYGKQWERALEFEENPRTYTFRTFLYFAYKYYYRSPELPIVDNIVDHFSNKPVHQVVFDPCCSISVGGDLMPYEMIKPGTTKFLWDKVGADFFGSDLVFANLETPLDVSQKSSFVPEVMLSDMHFNTDETTFSIFNGTGRYKGYDVLSVANNHSMDMGEAGLDATLWYLNQQSISAVGAKQKQSDPDFVIKEVNGIKIGFVAYTFSLNQLLPPEDKPWKVNYLPLNLSHCPTDRIEENVAGCREAGAEFIICSLHFGNAYQVYPSMRSLDLVQQLFERCGIDVIAGGHPHNLQPWRYYHYTESRTGKPRTGFAIYSLADFIAYDIYTWCHLCAWLKITIGRDELGDIQFKVDVNPLIMRREQNQLKLYPAAELLNSVSNDSELKDIRILYDICKD